LLFLEFPAAFSVGLKHTTTATATRNVTKQKGLMSSTMATRVRFKSLYNHRSFWIYVCGKIDQGNHKIIVTSSILNSSVFRTFSECFPSTLTAFSNSSNLKAVFEKLLFGDGLVWTVSPLP